MSVILHIPLPQIHSLLCSGRLTFMDCRTWTSLLSGLSCVWGVRGMAEEVWRRQGARYLLYAAFLRKHTSGKGSAPRSHSSRQAAFTCSSLSGPGIPAFSPGFLRSLDCTVSYCNSLNSTVPSVSLTHWFLTPSTSLEVNLLLNRSQEILVRVPSTSTQELDSCTSSSVFPLYTLQPPTKEGEAHSVLSWTTQLTLDQAQIPQPKFKKKHPNYRFIP